MEFVKVTVGGRKAGSRREGGGRVFNHKRNTIRGEETPLRHSVTSVLEVSICRHISRFTSQCQNRSMVTEIVLGSLGFYLFVCLMYIGISCARVRVSETLKPELHL